MPLLVRSACLTNYVEVCDSLDIDPYALLKSHKINAACLTDPDKKVSTDAIGRLLEASAAAAGVEDFGLRMAETRRLSNLGPLGMLAREEPTIRKALESLQHYLHLHNEGIVFRLEEANGIAVLREEIITEGKLPITQAVDLSQAVTLRILRVLLGAGWAPRRVCFRHRPPRDASSYLRVFGPRVEFNSDIDGIVCRSDDLDAKIENADPVTARYIHQSLDALAAQSHTLIEDKVRQMIWILLPSGLCSVERVAQHLGLNRRTVHRQLEQHGQTFSGILDSVRAELVVRHLVDQNRSLGEISSLLGFAAQSAFSRWFSQRFACSPKAWRRGHGAP
jgi:AraC-like DNA-binding protein